MIRRLLLSAILIVSTLPLSVGQQPQPSSSPQQKKPATSPTQPPPETESQDVVKITTNLVQVDVSVTKDGKQVTDLTPEDFELMEDGKPQTITNFSYISNFEATPANAQVTPPAARKNDKDKTAPPVLPAVARPHEVRRTIALVVDDLGMSFQSVSLARKQARKFIDEQIQPNDLVAIIRTSGEVGALQQFTTDRRVLYNAIDRLRWYPCSRAGVHVFTPLGLAEVSGDASCGGSRNIRGTLQALKFIVQGMRELPGRKSLVLLSDYLPVETQEPGTNELNPGDDGLGDERTDYRFLLNKVAEMAIRGSVVIYAVDTRGLAYTGITAMDDLKGMSTSVNARGMSERINQTLSSRSMLMISRREGGALIAKETGGFLVRNSNDFDLKRIADDQKGYYLLGYRPSQETFNRKFHHLKVNVKRRGLAVRTRNGFYGIGEESERPAELSPTDQLKKALISPFGSNEINVRLTTLFTNFETGSLLRSLIYIKAQDLAFVDEPDGGHKATFDLGIILFGENGSVKDQQSRLVTLKLSKDAYESAVRNGIVYALDTPLNQTGAFQFRIALRDQTSSRIGSAGQFVQIPNLSKGRLALSGLVLLRDTGDKSNSGPDAQDAITSGPAVRQFRQGAKVIFAYSIYNAPLDAATHLPQLTTQTRIFREGKPVFSVDPTPVEVNPQIDLKRVPSVGRIQLGSEFPPGEYVLQIIVTDRTKDKQVATEWIDFEIVK
jgi:VWFA-related protein